MDRADKPLLSPREAARIFGCSRSSIMRALAAKTLPAIRGNENNWLIRHEDLERWSANRTALGPAMIQDSGPVEVRTMSKPDHETLTRLVATEERAKALAVQIDTLRVELAHTQERLATTTAHLTQRLADVQAERAREVAQLREDRDRWHALATTPEPTWVARLWTSLLGRPSRV